MKKFKVSVVRISYAVREIEIEAESEEAAKELALDEAGNYEFSEHNSDYEVESVFEAWKIVERMKKS